MPTQTEESFISEMRDELLKIENFAKNHIHRLRESSVNWEVIAQATLAMRHIEDARMRYWKVLQYLWDWVSIYDKK